MTKQKLTALTLVSTALFSATALAQVMSWRAGESRQVGFGHCAQGPCVKRVYWGESKPHRHVDGKVVSDSIVWNLR